MTDVIKRMKHSFSDQEEKGENKWTQYVVYEYDPIEAYATFLAADLDDEDFESMRKRVASTEFMSSETKVKWYELIVDDVYRTCRFSPFVIELKDAPEHFRNVKATFDIKYSPDDTKPEMHRLNFESDKTYFELLKSVKDEQGLLQWTYTKNGYKYNDFNFDADGDVEFEKNKFVRATYDDDEGKAVTYRLGPKDDDWEVFHEEELRK